MTFNQASGPAVDPGEGREEEPEKYSDTFTQNKSGSEHSFHSQRSFSKDYFGKTFQPQTSHPKRNSNSHKSNGSLGGLSRRSSNSDILSDKAESLGSVGSGNRGKTRLVTEGQSGSEGSDYPGRGTLSGLGGQSDNESFWPTDQRHMKSSVSVCVHSAKNFVTFYRVTGLTLRMSMISRFFTSWHLDLRQEFLNLQSQLSHFRQTIRSHLNKLLHSSPSRDRVDVPMKVNWPND